MKNGTNKYVLLLKRLIRFPLILAIYLLCTTAGPLFAQDINNLHFEKVLDEGLTNSYITSIGQDNNGFMWFGTREGLYRYDGYSFKSFRNIPGDPTTLMNSQIQTIHSEGDKLWVGSFFGLSYIDINSQIIKNIPAPVHFVVFTILPINSSTFWVGTSSGLFEFNKTTFKWKRITTLDKMAIAWLGDDKKGHIYIIPGLHGLYRYTISTATFKYFPLNLSFYPRLDKNTQPSLGNSFIDAAGKLWICSWGGGLVQFNMNTGKITQWHYLNDDVHLFPYKITKDILPDRDGNLWLANKEGGLTIFDPAKNKFINYPVDWKSESRISSALISLFRDKSGTVWIGTENGIFKNDPHNVHLSRTDVLLKTDTGLVQSHIAPTVMLKDKGGLWLMGMYEGIFGYDDKTHVLQDYNKAFGIPENLAVFNIVKDSGGAIWFTARNLLIKLTKKAGAGDIPYNVEIFKSPVIQSTICGLFIDNEKRIWLGTHANGFFRFDPGSKTFIPYYSQAGKERLINQIFTICALSDDSLLMGGVNSGLILLHTNTGRTEKVSWDNTKNIIDPSINTIYKNGGNLWIATDDGLWETNTLLKQPVITTINDGFPSMVISSLTIDKQNNLWILANLNVVEFQPQYKKITVFDKKNVIQSSDQIFSMLIDDSDNITIAGRGCLYNFNPVQIVKNTQPPRPFIEDLRVFDKEYNAGKGQPIELDYNQNYFSLDYVALNYTQSKLNRYAYKMDGLDKKWNDAGTRRYVSYANLEEGTYTFNVKACNNEGVWNNVPAKLVLIINPPFWHRWVFYLLVFALASGIIYSLYIYNINQLKIRLEMRDKIARDLHDDIGSTLSGINIFSKIALQKLGTDRRGSRELLEKISDRSEKTMDALSDIVWSINTRNDGMDNFLMKANEYLSELLEVQGIPYNFTVDPEMHNLKIGMILRKELYLIFKETICNASKYSGCSFIQIYLTRHKDLCTLTIHDNGIGFNTSTVSTGNGIYNMRQRAKKINAELVIESEINKGTQLTLRFRIPRFR